MSQNSTSVGNVVEGKFGPKEENYTNPGDPIRDMVANVLGFSSKFKIDKFEPNYLLNDTVTVTFSDGSSATYNRDGNNVNS